MDMWTTARAVETTVRGVDALDEPEAIIRLSAATYCGMRKEFGDIGALATGPTSLCLNRDVGRQLVAQPNWLFLSVDPDDQ